LSNEKAAADVTEAVHNYVSDWSQAAVMSLQRRRIDKIAVVALEVVLLDHAHFRSSVAQVRKLFHFYIFSDRLVFMENWTSSSSFGGGEVVLRSTRPQMGP